MFLGKRMRCIACSHVFLAGEPAPAAAPTAYPLNPADEETEPERPSAPPRGLPRHRVPLCPRCHRPVGWAVPACPHCNHLFESESSSAASPWAQRRDGVPHRGEMIDTLGTVCLLAGSVGACLVLGPLVALATGIPALLMSNRDLEQMNHGLVDPAGRHLTEMGRNKAIVGLVLAVILGVTVVLGIVHYSG
jgi:hypothetical protein